MTGGGGVGGGGHGRSTKVRRRLGKVEEEGFKVQMAMSERLCPTDDVRVILRES